MVRTEPRPEVYPGVNPGRLKSARTDLYRGALFLGAIPEIKFTRLKGLRFEDLAESSGLERISRFAARAVLKLASPDQPRGIENEFFFLRMARACGLVVHDAELVRDQRGVAALLVRRDAEVGGVRGVQGTWSAPSKDEFSEPCPSEKYPRTFSEIAAGLDVCSTPVLEVGKLIRAQAFSYLIVNGNLHARNFSLHTVSHRGRPARIELTPAYDLLSTLPYGDQRMALKFEGRDDHLKRQDFIDFGERHGVKAPATRAILDDICKVADEWIDRLGEIGLGNKKTAHLRQVMLKRKADLQNG